MALKGYEITFFTHEDCFHGSTQMSDWLILSALNLGLRGATVMTGSEGYGHNRHVHSARLFEPADNPQEIVIICNEDEADRLFEHLQEENVDLFYVRKVVEFGMLGKPD